MLGRPLSQFYNTEAKYYGKQGIFIRILCIGEPADCLEIALPI